MQVPGQVVAASVQLEGRLDVTTATETREILHAAVEEGDGDLVVDLSCVELIDVTGLGVLVGTHRKALRAHRTLVLRNVPPRMMRLLAMTRLYRALCVESPWKTRTEASTEASTENEGVAA